jgi:hypothetical protein
VRQLVSILGKDIIRDEKEKLGRKPSTNDFAIGTVRVSRALSSQHHIGVEHGLDFHALHSGFQGGDEFTNLLGNPGTIKAVGFHFLRRLAGFPDQFQSLRREALLPLRMQNGLRFNEAHDTLIKVGYVFDLIGQIVR